MNGVQFFIRHVIMEEYPSVDDVFICRGFFFLHSDSRLLYFKVVVLVIL